VFSLGVMKKQALFIIFLSILIIPFVNANCSIGQSSNININTQLVAVNNLDKLNQSLVFSNYQFKPYYREDDLLLIQEINLKNTGNCASKNSSIIYKIKKPNGKIINNALCNTLQVPSLDINESYSFFLKNVTWSEYENVWFPEYFYEDSFNRTFSNLCYPVNLDIPGNWNVNTTILPSQSYSGDTFSYKGFLYKGKFKVKEGIEVETINLTHGINLLTWILVILTLIVILTSLIPEKIKEGLFYNFKEKVFKEFSLNKIMFTKNQEVLKLKYENRRDYAFAELAALLVIAFGTISNIKEMSLTTIIILVMVFIFLLVGFFISFFSMEKIFNKLVNNLEGKSK